MRELVSPGAPVLIELFRANGLEDTGPDALRPGTRIVKCNSEPEDGHADGAPGRLVFITVPLPEHLIGYALAFVEWDDVPGVSVAVRSDRIRRAD